MNSDRAVFSLIARLYEAAANQQLWPPFLESLSDALHGNGTQVIVFNTRSHGGEAIATARVDPDYLKSYNDYYIGRDYWALHGSRYFQKPGVITGQMICSDEELERSEFGADFLRPMDALHMIGAVAAIEGDELSVVTSLRPQRAGPFGQDESAVMEALLPHFERALQLRRRLAAVEAQSSALAGMLDRLPLGLILVDSRGKVLVANHAAEGILAQCDGLTAARGGLETVQPHETATLRGLISGACTTGSGRGISSGGAMNVSRPSLNRPLSVLIVPLFSNPFDIPGLRPAAAVFVSDPEAEMQPNEVVISRFFGLTGAESRIAALLMRGKSIEEAAEELDLTLNTARSHVKRIYSKTGTNRQGELIRLLLTSPAQLRFP